jgi:hypothetical protein
MKDFHTFVKNTKNDCIYIGIGLVIILLSLVMKLVFKISTLIINIIALLILYYALMSIAKHTKIYVDSNPDFLYDLELRKNILLSGFVSVMLVVLIIYITYTLFF